MSDRNPSASYSIDDLNLHVERVRQLASHDDPALRALFDRNSPIHIARGPGRLDIMGGIGDYSGSLVLEMPIADAAFAAAQESRDGEIRIASLTIR
jgi:galactokinase